MPAPSASLPENAQEHYIMFARSHLAAGGPVDTALQELQSSGITLDRTIQARADCQTSHLHAVFSFSTLLFGMQHKQTNITQQGYARHGVTLQHLNSALSEPNCYMFDEIIVSVTTLAIQETLVPTGPQFFMNHMLGLQKLLALRDPRVYCSPRSIVLYKCLRHMLLIASLSGGTPSILAQPEWKALLRRCCDNEQQLQEQDLFDVLADCSGLLFECDQLLRVWDMDDEDRESRTNVIKGKAQALLSNLRDWRTQWETDERNAYVEMPIRRTSLQGPEGNESEMSSTEPTDMIFTHVSANLMFLLYNIALNHVLQILISIPLESESKAEYVSAAHHTLWEICRALPYQSSLSDELETHASPVVHWAMHTVRLRLKDVEPTEERMMTDVLERKSAEGISRRLQLN
jgi:hypothetical protein